MMMTEEAKEMKKFLLVRLNKVSPHPQISKNQLTARDERIQ